MHKFGSAIGQFERPEKKSLRLQYQFYMAAGERYCQRSRSTVIDLSFDNPETRACEIRAGSFFTDLKQKFVVFLLDEANRARRRKTTERSGGELRNRVNPA
jgi:hypothetical protein